MTPVTEGELTFDVADPVWRGDLGLFLARRIAPAARRASSVKVAGAGTWPMTPVRLPDGMSLGDRIGCAAGARARRGSPGPAPPRRR